MTAAKAQTFKAPELISAEVLRKFSEIRVSSSLIAIALDWGLIVAAIAIASAMNNFFVDLLALILIARTQHALLVLVHEGAHYRLVSQRKMNDFIANLFCAYPIFFCTQGYRAHHFKHHKHLNTDQDPDWVRKISLSEWQYPQTSFKLLGTACKVLLTSWYKLILLFWALSGIGRKVSWTNPQQLGLVLSKLAFYAVVTAALYHFQAVQPFLLYWVLPYLVLMPVIERVRSISEHFGLPYTHEFNQSRNVVASGIDKFLFSPHGVGYHLDHHLYPTVPHYNLPALHQCLMEAPEFRRFAHNNDAYVLGGQNPLLADIRALK